MASGANSTQTTFMYVGGIVHALSVKKAEYITAGIIVVKDGKIVHFQDNANDIQNVMDKYNLKDEQVVKLKKEQFLIPGFIDCHIHASQYPNAGLGYDLTLFDWLQKYTFPLEKKFSSENFAQKIYDTVIKKTLAFGTTTAVYFATIHSTTSCILGKSAKKYGQRAFIGKVNMNKNILLGYGETFEESVKATKSFIDGITALNSDLIKPIITPRFALSCDEKLLQHLGKIATDQKLPVQTHISETKEEVERVKQEFPDYKNYLDVYNKSGLVSDTTVLAHGIYLEKDEINVIKEKKATVVHCPASNLLLQSGICPVKNYLVNGVKVALGTDVSGGNTVSMLDAIRLCLMISGQVPTGENTKVNIDEALYMATLAGAEALKLDGVIGNFAVGKDFDCVVVDLNNNPVIDLFDEYDLHEMFEKFIYLGDDRAISKVYVRGKLVKLLN